MAPLDHPVRNPATTDEGWALVCEIDSARRAAGLNHAELCGGRESGLYWHWQKLQSGTTACPDPGKPWFKKLLRLARNLAPVSRDIDARRFNGLGWRDMGGPGEFMQKCNFSLYQRGLYDPATDKDIRARRFATYGRIRAAKNPYPAN